jgi:4-carboxymuconolactone decarboxylase
MRLPPIAPQDMSAEQQLLYEDMKSGVAAKYSLFKTMRDDGAFLGPWNAWLHEPQVGAAFWNTTKAMTRFKVIPERVRQILILARQNGLSDQFISTLVSGSRPEGMTDEEGIGYDVAHVLSGGRRLPDDTYVRALALFGQKGTNELIYLVAHYCFVSVTLNGFDVPVPRD